MGLDTIELVFSIEKHFDISITNQDAEKIFTVQDFADLVFTKVTRNPTEKCRSQMLFYKFRNYFVDRLGMPRNEITPAARIKDIIGVNAQGIWTELERHLNVKLPELSILDSQPTKEKEVRNFGFRLWTKKAPMLIATLGDLVSWTLAMNYDKLIDARRIFNKEDVERTILGIVSESSGIPVDEIKMWHSITDDLGMD
jgi:acyl carrier protein